MEEQKVYEQCDHQWETIEKQKEYDTHIGNSFFGGTVYYKIVYIQQCTKCGKINKV